MALSALLVCGGLIACQDDIGIKATPATVSVAATIPVGLESFYNQKVFWCVCDKRGMGEATSGEDTDFTCVEVKVPLDYDNPGGETTEIAVKKQAANGGSVGSLLAGPGGPGGSDIELVESAGSYFSKNLTSSYDAIDFDPHGVGASTVVDCLINAKLDAERAGVNNLAVPSAVTTQERVRKVGEVCTSKTSPAGLLGYIDIINAAKDLDVLRAVDGRQALTYLGSSYGTYPGITYAELSPANAGRLIFDGVIDPSLSAADLTLGQTEGSEASLRVHVQNCQSPKLGCPLSRGADSGVSQVHEFLESMKAASLPTSGGEQPLTYDSTVYGVLGSVYQTQLWPFLTLMLSQAMGKAGTPDGSVLLTIADAVPSRQSDGSYFGSDTEAPMAISHLNYSIQGDNTSWGEEAKAANETSPTFDSQLLCLDVYYQSWGHASNRKREEITASGAAPTLVIGTTGDPVIPYAWSEALVDQLESGRLMTQKGNRHTAYGRSNDCVEKTVSTYLLNGTVPTKGLTC